MVCYQASPKAISGRTSYLRVRLEFLPYPQLIPALFNGRGFGPPQPFTAPSSWSWIDHPVSGLCLLTLALFTLGLPSAPQLKLLNLASTHNSPDRSTKSTRLHMSLLAVVLSSAFSCLSASAHHSQTSLRSVCFVLADQLKLSRALLLVRLILPPFPAFERSLLRSPLSFGCQAVRLQATT